MLSKHNGHTNEVWTSMMAVFRIIIEKLLVDFGWVHWKNTNPFEVALVNQKITRWRLCQWRLRPKWQSDLRFKLYRWSISDWQGSQKAGYPSISKPHGSRSDCKRRDGLTSLARRSLCHLGCDVDYIINKKSGGAGSSPGCICRRGHVLQECMADKVQNPITANGYSKWHVVQTKATRTLK